MSRHPVTPSNESDLRLHLGKQTKKRAALFDILHVALPEAESRSALDTLLADSPDIVLFDALTKEDLARIGALIDAYAGSENPLFSVGSSGIEMALGAHWAEVGKLHANHDWPDPGPAKPLLVMSGSCSPVTGSQIAWAISQGFADVQLNASALANGGDCENAIREIIAQLQAGHHVVAHTCPSDNEPPLDSKASAKLGNALGQIARAAIAETDVRRLVVAGGDTSSHAARALGIESVEMLAPLAPGAPLCRVHAPNSPFDGGEVNFKGGQVGAPDYFDAVARGCI